MRILTARNEATYVNFGYDDYASLIKDAKRNIFPNVINLYIGDLSVKQFDMLRSLVYLFHREKKLTFNIYLDTDYGIDYEDIFDDAQLIIIRNSKSIFTKYGKYNH